MIKLIPTFSASEDVLEWIKKCERIINEQCAIPKDVLMGSDIHTTGTEIRMVAANIRLRGSKKE